MNIAERPVSHPRCPSCGVTMRDHPKGYQCPECGIADDHSAEFAAALQTVSTTTAPLGSAEAAPSAQPRTGSSSAVPD